MKRALVAGGAGFIGSHLCERLLAMEFAVTCVDNLQTGSATNISSCQKSDHFIFVEGDVSAPLDLPGGCEWVFHLASPASPVDFERLSIEIMRANVLGSVQLLEYAKASRSRYLFASTSEVYGDPLVHPQTEDYWGNVNPIGIRSPYDEAKRFGETYATAFCKKHDLDFAIARIFNTYGPRMPKDGRVMEAFFSAALAGENLTMFGDGSQTRSFCFVEDLVRGLILQMECAAGTPINLGSEDEITIKQLADEIIALTNSTSDVTSLPLPANDPKTRRPSIEKAKDELKWQPEISRASGLSRTLSYFKQSP